MTTNSTPDSPEKMLKELSQFENFFHKSNLLLGFRMWIKVYSIWFLVAFTSALVGLLGILGSFGLLLLVGLQFYLFQWAATVEARRMYGINILGSCWWSIIWRINLYMLPVWMVFSLMMPEGYMQNFELVEQNPGPLMTAQLILLLLSIIPMGMVTSQAFLKSFLRIKLLKSDGFSTQASGSDDKKHDREKYPDEANNEDSNAE